MMPQHPRSTLFPYTTLFRSVHLVAPRARIMPLKAFKADGSGYASDVLRAIYYAENVRGVARAIGLRSEEHTSELQSLAYLVCRLLLEKKNHLSLRHSRIPLL